MGYTHYWNTKPELDKKQWKAFIKDVKVILQDGFDQQIIQHDSENSTPQEAIPEANAKRVWFNGRGEEGHETFVFSRKAEIQDYQEDKAMAFNFCKTAQKPYDKYVVACLILAKIHFKDNVLISSDGDVPEWQEGVELINETLHLNVKMEGGLNVDEATITYENPEVKKAEEKAEIGREKEKQAKDEVMRKVDAEIKEELDSLVG